MSGRAQPWTLKTVRDRCDIDPAGGCWIWRHATTGPNKQPQACIEGKTGSLVARWVVQHGGRSITGMAVRPTCGERLCLNPAHLEAVSKGRVLADAYAAGNRNAAAEYPAKLRGAQRAGLAKLDMPKAREVRARIAAGESVEGLARELGMWPKTISDIKHNRSWRESTPGSSAFNWRPA